ncbi:malonyl CoA-acyl carrier protein transacylase [Listeria grayi FSL F6-1183]|uniref:[acyl-carrier-protein] S-malonyltransferase n=2 Tax=Listeria grayi TaxID=1641 RepID=A0A829R6G3_LISGR|nr:malonyl CoA-acyl carrier protein transacylase [Listeria grayi FSL F6-1183]
MPLAVSGPFHSTLMKPASEAFVPVLQEVTIQDGAIPVVANSNAEATTSGDTVVKNLIEQIYSPVLWEDTVRYLIDQGVDTFVEIGAGKVLAGLIKKIDRGVTVLSAGDVASVETVIETLKGE